MLTGYRPKYFKPYEWVPKYIYDRYGESSIRFLDSRILFTADCLREHFNSDKYKLDNGKERHIIINDWYWDGKNEWRGLRTPRSPYYNETSMHSFGGAGDLIVIGIDPEDVRRNILKNLAKFPYLTRMEKDVNWVHIDNQNNYLFKNGIFLFSKYPGSRIV